jgi:hypothetical protein
MPGACLRILQIVEPEIFQGEGLEEIPEPELNYFLCRLVGAQMGTFLPTQTHDVPATVEALAAALSQHYIASGGLVGPKTLENLRKGYYVEDGKVITCVLDSAEPKTQLKFEYAEEVTIAQPLDVLSLLTVKTGGRELKIDSMAQEFLSAGVPLPELEVEWKGELFGEKKNDSPQKKRKSVGSNGNDSLPASAFASASSQRLGEALRRKLSKTKEGDESKGSKASGD